MNAQVLVKCKNMKGKRWNLRGKKVCD